MVAFHLQLPYWLAFFMTFSGKDRLLLTRFSFGSLFESDFSGTEETVMYVDAAIVPLCCGSILHSAFG